MYDSRQMAKCAPLELELELELDLELNLTLKGYMEGTELEPELDLEN